MAKGGRGCFRLSYGRPKLTLVSKKRSPTLRCPKKMYLPKSSKLSLPTQITSSYRLWEEMICVGKLNSGDFGRYIYFGHLIILLTERILLPSTDFGRPKQGQKIFVPPFHMDFLNPECVRIPWLKNFPLKIFGYGAIYKIIPFFTNFCVLKQKKSIGLVYPQF